MKPANARFEPFASYDGPPDDLKAVIDFSRSLEDLAHHVVAPWAVVALDDEGRPPTPAEAADAPALGIGDEADCMRAWLCARLDPPPLAKLIDPANWGAWRLQIDSDGLGDVYVDGKLAAERVFLHGDVELRPARGGDDRPWICCSLDTTIQNVALEMTRCRLSGLDEINALVRDVARSLRIAGSLLLTDNPRVNRFMRGEVSVNRSPLPAERRASLAEALCSAAACVDVAAFSGGKLDTFVESLRRCRDALAPLAEFAREFHIFLLGVSHMDLAWKWRWGESVECMHGTLAAQLKSMAERPDFTFLESNPPIWIAMKDRDPDQYDQLVAAGKRGQLEPAGGMWCEPDGQMLGDESWVRQLLFGQRAAVDILGQASRAGHNTDAFGFTWSLPKIYAAAGVEAFLTQKLRYNEYTIFEDVLFWWESDDGTRILGVHTYPDHYQEIDPDELVEAMRIFHLTSGVSSAAILFGIGNHGGGPLPDMFDRVDAMRELTVCPQIHLAGMHEYLDHLRANEAGALAALPVIRDELFLECHHKTYSTQALVKQRNRQAERALQAAEALAALAGLRTAELLREAWEKVLFNQFHDILPGSSFPMVYQDVHDDYDRTEAIVSNVAAQALERLLGPGDGTYVVNTLPWKRTGAVLLDGSDLPDCGVMADDAGDEVAFQQTGEDGKVVAAAPLPALGLRRLDGPTGRDLPAIEHGDSWVSTRFFRAEFDADRGVVGSLTLPDGVELVADGLGRLDLLEDDPHGFYQSWNMNLTGREDPARCDRFELIEAGPVRVRFRGHMSFGRWEKKKLFMVPIMWNTPGVDYPTSFFVIDYTIYADLPWIDCVMRADWWEDDTDLKVAADTALTNTRAIYGIAFGQIERPTKRETPYEKARFEVPALNWADLTDGAHGVAILNTGRHGHDAFGGRLRLTLLTSPCGGEKVHVVDPLADRGRHEIRYAFYPHAGGPEQGQVARVAREFEDAAVVAAGGKPALPVGEDLLAIDPMRALATAVKPAEDGDGLIVRCYEPYGESTPLEITGPLAAGPRQAVDLLEAPADADVDQLGPYEVRSVRIRGR